MPDRKIQNFGDSRALWTVPESDIARQAIASLRGYVYQIHQSASAWIDLKDGDVLYLEVAEDFAQVLRDPARLDDILAMTQVKATRESGRVTLNSPDVLDAVQSLFRMQAANPGREVRLTFLTTSHVGTERTDRLPSGIAGLEAWRVAAAGGPVAEIRNALQDRIQDGELKEFIRLSSEAQLRTKILAALSFVCGAHDWPLIAARNRIALSALHKEIRATPASADAAYDALLGHLITTLLTSSSRSLDREQLITFLKRATAVLVPAETAVRLLGEVKDAEPDKALDEMQLQEVSRTLLEVGTPPSILMLFPDTPAASRDALTSAMAFARTVIERDAAAEVPAAHIPLSGLLTRPERMHLVIATAGSGKTFTFWQCARQLLEDGALIPVFLPVGQLNSWSEAVAPISEAAPGSSAHSVLTDKRVCVFLDGWSEFAVGQHAGERQKALRALRHVRVIANGKIADVGDTVFKVWSLELLGVEQVNEIRERARPGSPALPDGVVDLLRFPLLLSLHVLSGSDSAAPGELLRQFHAHLARTVPEGFTEALAGAVATLSLTNDRSYGRFSAELRARAIARGITEPNKCLQRLGTILERSGHVVPIHDLYWSWLTGYGLVLEHRGAEAVMPLHTRESYALALQSGVSSTQSDVEEILNDDLVLAAALEVRRPSARLHVALSDALEGALKDSRLAVRSRGGLAALTLGTPGYLRRALVVLSEISHAGLQARDWAQALDPAALFAQRATLAEWLGSPGSDVILDCIAARGGPQWLPWLEQMCLSGKVTMLDALATALACAPSIPSWGAPGLDELLTSTHWRLSRTVERRANRILARYLASHYGGLVKGTPNQNIIPWLQLNRLLVACGDDETFRLLLDGFASASPHVQELAAWAVVDRGPPWVAAFQKIAFAAPGDNQHATLSEPVSHDIDDMTARRWIASGHDAVGWRVLIARHDAAVVPELIASLPPSFAGLENVPALWHLQYVKQAPTSLIPELLSRFGDPMWPKVLQDVMYALATVYPEGMTSIARLVIQRADDIPLYHIAQALHLYKAWRERSAATLMFSDPRLGSAPFEEWIVRHCALQRWHEHHVPEMLARLPDLAIELVLGPFGTDDDKAAKVLSMLKGVRSFHADLLQRMLSSSTLAPLVPQVFAVCFDTFPVDGLQRCIESEHINQEILLLRMAASSNPLHLPVHRQLITWILRQPISLLRYRLLASVLRAHTRYDLIELLQSALTLSDDNAVWFVREVETVRGERLINEAGQFRM